LNWGRSLERDAGDPRTRFDETPQKRLRESEGGLKRGGIYIQDWGGVSLECEGVVAEIVVEERAVHKQRGGQEENQWIPTMSAISVLTRPREEQWE